MKWKNGEIDGVALRKLLRREDERGWLEEGWRDDWGMASPRMAYVSSTNKGVARGPHEHREQTDFFVFLGLFVFRVWDNRPGSRTYGRVMTVTSSGFAAVVPPGVVHAYASLGDGQLVVNLPDRLYGGEGGAGPVDEVRHEGDPRSPFKVDDMKLMEARKA